MRNVLIGFATAVILASVVLVAPGTVPPDVREVLGIGPNPLGRPPKVDGSGSYRFLARQLGDRGLPVAYSPCRPIHVVVNTDGAPDEEDAREMVLAAMKRVGAATGLRLVYDGPSTERPRWESPTRPLLGRTRPVLVSFATAEEVPELEGRVAGVGGSISVRRNGIRVYVTGQVTLDIDSIKRLRAMPGGDAVAEAITLHEFGHLVGLAHVDDRGELMYATNTGQLDFGTGDRSGLAQLGAGRCA